MEGGRAHLVDLILECFRKRPNVICQVDAATGESETNASVLSRSIKAANSLRAAGLVVGDVVALSGRNHLDIHIPYYAALFNGLPLLGVDPLFKIGEIKSLLKLTSPKIAFCEQEDYETYVQAACDLGLPMKVITFGDGEHSMEAFVREYGPGGNEDDFKPAVLDTAKAYVWLISTSGTSGVPKVAAFTYDTVLEKTLAYTRLIKLENNSSENKPALNISPVQWVSGVFNPVGMPVLQQTMVQTSAPATVEHIIDIINKYKPKQTLLGPATVSYILKHDKKCDLTCFKMIIVGGAKVPGGLLSELKSQMGPEGHPWEMYGQTETLGPVLAPQPNTPLNSCGGTTPLYRIKLVDPGTGLEITEPNVTGEMYVKGNIFTEYYNSPEMTKEVYTEDRWYKTGDLLYRDENNNYFYVERIKTLIKYQNNHVIPGELEEVIRRHPGVYDVAVTGVPHPVDGEWPAACVVLEDGATVTAAEIHKLVNNNLSEKKQLRGGVIILNKLPQTSSGKTCIRKVKEIAINAVKDNKTHYVI